MSLFMAGTGVAVSEEEGNTTNVHYRLQESLGKTERNVLSSPDDWSLLTAENLEKLNDQCRINYKAPSENADAEKEYWDYFANLRGYRDRRSSRAAEKVLRYSHTTPKKTTSKKGKASAVRKELVLGDGNHNDEHETFSNEQIYKARTEEKDV